MTGSLPATGVPTPQQCAAAARRLTGRVRRTPVLELPAGDLCPWPVTLKLETLQHTGSFKARGALNAVLTAPPGTTSITAASGGNHGAAVAWAAHQAGLPADIFVPAFVPPAKAALVKQYGATLHLVEGFYADALSASRAHAEQHDAYHVDAYDDPDVVAGQSMPSRSTPGARCWSAAVAAGCSPGSALPCAGVTPLWPSNPRPHPHCTVP